MSRKFTSETAPRVGGKLGRKAKLSGLALQILEMAMVDWKKYGPRTLKVLRLENPVAYARLCLEASTRVALAGSEIEAGGPMVLGVRWGAPTERATPPPLPPETAHPEPPPRGPMVMPRLLSFERPLDQ